MTVTVIGGNPHIANPGRPARRAPGLRQFGLVCDRPLEDDDRAHIGPVGVPLPAMTIVGGDVNVSGA
jgi:hypothetical protein